MRKLAGPIMMAALLFAVHPEFVSANAYRETGKPVQVGKSEITVIPPRDWNRLDAKPGKYTEVWTLDGDQLNDVTFYGGVEAGSPLVKERDKKRAPLPKFTTSTLLVEIPELLEGTYRASKQIGEFTLTGSEPTQFLGHEGVSFTYNYTDRDELPRKGEARAVVIGKKLYMATFDAPRLHFFDDGLPAYRALVATAKLGR